jgi:hypothetical protein
MVDFARWAVAAEPDLGVPEGAVALALAGNRSGAVELALDASPLVPPLLRLPLPWTGTATELMEELARGFGTVPPPRGWPINPQVLSRELRQLAPDLRRRGVDIEFPDGKRRDLGRQLRITRTPAEASDLTAASLPAQGVVTAMDGRAHTAVAKRKRILERLGEWEASRGSES